MIPFHIISYGRLLDYFIGDQVFLANYFRNESMIQAFLSTVLLIVSTILLSAAYIYYLVTRPGSTILYTILLLVFSSLVRVLENNPEKYNDLKQQATNKLLEEWKR
jgi:hypothetical protein